MGSPGHWVSGILLSYQPNGAFRRVRHANCSVHQAFCSAGRPFARFAGVFARPAGEMALVWLVGAKTSAPEAQENFPSSTHEGSAEFRGSPLDRNRSDEIRW